ncbi:hypothetical protein CERSUDRAFT_60787 [Gelatoporia subvermispora B]|uniref:USP domain-containing protein n=1 Tax=Ceriporiopsis subvermispora (strain B) TaxID=914234 RepID=M2QFR9_CERS8|nr:hypothetical protein CERSUDRAFT_60787 [Gelatoporia subvermispora B]
MRQRGASDDDVRFRTCLDNMRYGACTPEDITHLRKRITARRIGCPRLTEARFRGVSVITSFNAHRDVLNEMGCERYALDSETNLVSFHSHDTWPLTRQRANTKKQVRDEASVFDPVRTSSVIPELLQTALWRLPPVCTEHVPGMLNLAVGMPVLLKNNEATELCATNGAEGVVVGWDSTTDDSNRRFLRTVFVRLTSPPRSVQIPGLPLNVIPVTTKKTRVKCLLPNDQVVTIDREQPMILPNFAMTDFCSQGRTRVTNVVDLHNCKNSLSMYTCLSRSSSYDGTLIIREFDTKKITSGTSGNLRREYRELELLDFITLLREEHRLPDGFPVGTRSACIQAFQLWKGKHFVPPRVHGALSWASEDPSHLHPPENLPQWRLVSKVDSRKRSADPPPNNVAKKVKHSSDITDIVTDQVVTMSPQNGTHDVMHGNTYFALSNFVARGSQWDSTNYSCAYDALVTILWNLRADRGAFYFSNICPAGTIMNDLEKQFSECSNVGQNLEIARDRIRDCLSQSQPRLFPRTGPEFCAVADVAEHLFDGMVANVVQVVQCQSCAYRMEESTSYLAPSMPVENIRIDKLLNNLLNSCPGRICSQCGAKVNVAVHHIETPWILFVELPVASQDAQSFVIPRSVELDHTPPVRTWKLAGIVYGGGSHFTARYCDTSGKLWFHDGISTGSSCISEGFLTDVDLYSAYGRQACLVMYIA